MNSKELFAIMNISMKVENNILKAIDAASTVFLPYVRQRMKARLHSKETLGACIRELDQLWGATMRKFNAAYPQANLPDDAFRKFILLELGEEAWRLAFAHKDLQFGRPRRFD